MEPWLHRQSLTWADVQPAFELVDSMAELEEALGDPEAFFENLMNSGGPVAIKMLIAKLRPQVEPQIHRKGLQWADVQPLLESVDSKEKLQQALNDPASFLEELLKGAGGQVARKLLLSKLKLHMKPWLHQQGLTWEDVQPAFELVDSMAVLEDALGDPEAFFQEPNEYRWPCGNENADCETPVPSGASDKSTGAAMAGCAAIA
jgi:hypothetical protein